MTPVKKTRPFSSSSHLSPTTLLQLTFFAAMSLTLALHFYLRHTSAAQAARLLQLVTDHKLVLASIAWCLAASLTAYLLTRPRPVLLLDYSCFLPQPDRRLSYEVCEYYVRRSRRYTTRSEEFMRGIYLKSGLGDETYAPPFIFGDDYESTLEFAVQEAEEGMFSSVDALLSKSLVPASLIDAVIVTSGSFAPAPSLASRLVNHYGLNPGVKTYNLAGMGCSSGLLSIDMAAKLLSSSRRVKYVLVVATEGISLNWYFGDDRSMLVTNCIFRVGCAAAILTNDPARRRDAKMELDISFRTHHGADYASYTAAFQGEDEEGNPGVSLKKDLIRVAGAGLKEHIISLAPRVLPISQLVSYACNYISARWWPAAAEGKKTATPHVAVPDFTTAFEHVCIHTGGKAVIESVARALGLSETATEPARMALHRFGNTSSSLVFYELAYFEAKGRVKAGDRMWMLAFGTGFKVCSVAWRALKDAGVDSDNPWRECAHRYPLKAW